MKNLDKNTENMNQKKEKKTVSVYRALNMKKSLKARIEKAIIELNTILVKKSKTAKANNQTDSQNEKDIRAAVESVETLIKNYDELVRAITRSNATTQVEICGEKMSVAELITRTQSDGWIMFMKSYARRVDRNIEDALREKEYLENSLENRFDKFLTALAGSDKKNLDPATVSRHQAEFYETNGQVLIDPIDAKKKLEKLDGICQTFSEEVNSILAETNAKTEIELSFL